MGAVAGIGRGAALGRAECQPQVLLAGLLHDSRRAAPRPRQPHPPRQQRLPPTILATARALLLPAP